MPVIAGGIALLVPSIMWFGAGRVARYLVPSGSDLVPARDYDEWQRMGLTCVGIFVLLRVILVLPSLVAAFNQLDAVTLVELIFYLLAAILLMLGWRAPVRLLTWPFRRR